MSREAYNYKRTAIIAAKELGYGESIIAKLELAQTVSEIRQIMISARLNIR